jgi:hypothetical protein
MQNLSEKMQCSKEVYKEVRYEKKPKEKIT